MWFFARLLLKPRLPLNPVEYKISNQLFKHQNASKPKKMPTPMQSKLKRTY